MTYPFRNRSRSLRVRSTQRRSLGLVAGSGCGVPLAVIGVVVALFIGVGVWMISSYQARDTVVATVCDKESISTEDGHEYRVYTDEGTFVVKDILFNGTRFNSADVYGRIRVGETYEIEKKGWRLGFFSSFENILEARLAPEGHRHISGC